MNQSIFRTPASPIKIKHDADVVSNTADVLISLMNPNMVITQQRVWEYSDAEMRWVLTSEVSKLSSRIRYGFEQLHKAGDLIGEKTAIDPKTKALTVVTAPLTPLTNKIVQSTVDTILATMQRPLDDSDSPETKIWETAWEGWADGVDTLYDPITHTTIVEPAHPSHWVQHRLAFNWPGVKPVEQTLMLDTELDRLFGGPNTTESLLCWTMLGATLLRYPIPRVLWMKGAPGIGKSAFIRVAETLLSSVKFGPFEVEDDDGFVLDSIIGKSLITCHETEAAKKLENQRTLKKLWEHDTMSIRRKNKDRMQVKINANWMIAANFDPKVGAKGSSTLARILMLECKTTQKIRGTANDDPHFHTKMVREEGDLIVAKAVSTFMSTIKFWNVLTAPFSEELEETRKAESRFLEFFDHVYVVTGNKSDRLTWGEVAEEFREWLKAARGGANETFTVSPNYVRTLWKEEVMKGEEVHARSGEGKDSSGKGSRREYMLTGVKRIEAKIEINTFTAMGKVKAASNDEKESVWRV
jgi:hypothetical protein